MNSALTIFLLTKNCYATHRKDVIKISTQIRIRLKPDLKLQTRRPAKIPIHYRDKLIDLMCDLQKSAILKKIGSTLHE